MTKEESEEIADAFNKLFELALNWEKPDQTNFRNTALDVEEFERACRLLARLLDDAELKEAIWALTQSSPRIGSALEHPSLMDSFKLSEAERRVIKSSLKGGEAALATRKVLAK